MNYFLDVVKKYAVFSGRARRKEYWMYVLFYMIVAVVLMVIDLAVLDSQILTYALGLGLFLPSLGVTVRRLHDTGRTGWWVLISFVPFVGGIVLLVFLCLDGEQANQYGENPKLVPATV